MELVLIAIVLIILLYLYVRERSPQQESLQSVPMTSANTAMSANAPITAAPLDNSDSVNKLLSAPDFIKPVSGNMDERIAARTAIPFLRAKENTQKAFQYRSRDGLFAEELAANEKRVWWSAESYETDADVDADFDVKFSDLSESGEY